MTNSEIIQGIIDARKWWNGLTLKEKVILSTEETHHMLLNGYQIFQIYLEQNHYNKLVAENQQAVRASI